MSDVAEGIPNHQTLRLSRLGPDAGRANDDHGVFVGRRGTVASLTAYI